MKAVRLKVYFFQVQLEQTNKRFTGKKMKTGWGFLYVYYNKN